LKYFLRLADTLGATATIGTAFFAAHLYTMSTRDPPAAGLTLLLAVIALLPVLLWWWLLRRLHAKGSRFMLLGVGTAVFA
jgi:hypothetical protein